MTYKVEYFEESDGTIPVEEFILRQNTKMSAKIIRNLELLEIAGPALREPYSKEIRKGIFELRTSISNDTTRILYFFAKDGTVVLTNGFVKKTSKTPRGEIELAEKRRSRYLRRGW